MVMTRRKRKTRACCFSPFKGTHKKIDLLSRYLGQRAAIYWAILSVIIAGIVLLHHITKGPADYDQTLFQGTCFAKGALKRKEYLERRIRLDPADRRKKIFLHVKGKSMLPYLHPGDLVVVYVDSKINDAQVGEMVTYIAAIGPRQESYYTHAIIRISRNPWTGEKELITRGLNNSQCDPQRVTGDNFIGISKQL
jgi:hypothetical protein